MQSHGVIVRIPASGHVNLLPSSTADSLHQQESIFFSLCQIASLHNVVVFLPPPSLFILKDLWGKKDLLYLG